MQRNSSTQDIARPWLWPDHAIGKRESRELREEHNATVNSHADLLAACKAILDADEYAESLGITLDDHMNRPARRKMFRAAIASAEGGAA